MAERRFPGNLFRPSGRDVVVSGFVVTLGVLIVGGVAGFWSALRLVQTNQSVIDAHETFSALGQLLSTLKDAETGQRGYLLTRDPKYLAPYEEALARLDADEQALRALLADSPADLARLNRLDVLVEAKEEELRETIALAEGGNWDAALAEIETDQGKSLMDQARTAVIALQQSQRERLTRLQNDSALRGWTAIWSVVLTSGLGVVLLIASIQLHRNVTAIRQASAARLADERERLRVTLASIGDAVLTTDEQGRITSLNRIAEAICGWTAAEASGRPFDDVLRLVNEATGQTAENPVAKVLKEGRVVGLANNTLVVTRDGRSTPIDDSAAPIRDADGKLLGVVLVFRDITIRKRVAAAQAERLRVTSLRADISAALAHPQPLIASLEQCTAALAEHIEAAEARIWLVEEAASGVQPDDRGLTLVARTGVDVPLDASPRRLGSGESAIGRIATTRTPMLTHDDFQDLGLSDPEWAKREGVAAFVGFPLIVDHRVVGVIALFSRRAISEALLADLYALTDQIAQHIDRKRNEDAIRESEQRYRLVGQAANDAIWDWNLLTNEVTWNDSIEAVLGYPLDQVDPAASWWVDHIHPDDRDRIATSIHAVIDHGSVDTWDSEYRFRRADGTYAEVFDRGRVVRDETGRGVRMVGSMLDLTERRQAEERLRASEERLRLAVESAEIGTWDYDLQTGVTSWSDRLKTIAGIPRTATLTLDDAIAQQHPDDRPRTRQLIAKAVDPDGDGRYDNEYRLIRPDGETRIVVSRGQAYFRGEGDDRRAVRMIGTVIDVTERRHQEDQLRRSEERYRSLFNSMDEGFCVAEMIFDDQGNGYDYRLLEINPAFEKHSGLYGVEGKTAREVAPELEDTWHRRYGEVVKTGIPARFMIETVAMDGKCFDVYAFRIGEPGDNRFAILFSDITQRRRTEVALQESENRFRQVADTMPQMVWVTRPDGYHEYYNKRWYEYIGCTEAECLGDGWNAPIHPDDRERSKATWTQSLESGKPYEIEYRFRSRDGEYRWFLGRALPVLNDQGEIVKWYGTCTDIEDFKRIQEEARVAKSRLESTLVAAEIATWEFDTIHNRVWADANLARLYQITPEEAAGGPLDAYLRAVHPDDIPTLATTIRAALASPEQSEFEANYRIFNDEGKLRYVVARGRIERDETGQAVRMPGVVVDITAQREAEERLRFTLEATKVGQWELDLESGSLERTLLHDQLFGYQTFYPDWKYPHFLSHVVPEHREAVEAAMAPARLTGQDLEFECQIVRTDGTRAWIWCKGSVFATQDGRPRRAAGLIMDISDRKRVEDILRKRSTQVQRLAEVATRINLATDVASLLRVVNEEARGLLEAHQAVTVLRSDQDSRMPLTAVSRSEKYAAWSDEAFQRRQLQIAEKLAYDGQPVRWTEADAAAQDAFQSLTTDQGTVPPVRGWLSAPLIARDGHAIGVIELTDHFEGDFTSDDEAVLTQLAQMASVAIENARLYQELRDADRRKDEFLATLAHELRNPLAPIRTGLEAIKLAAHNPVQVEEIRAVMERQAQQMVRLIDDLLDVSRITRGKLDLRTCRVELASVVQSAVEATRPLMAELGHDLTVSMPREPLPLEGDPTRLAQVIANLLNNAAKYTPAGGKIDLLATQEGQTAVLTVRDTGIGIPADMLDQIFDLFTQVDRSLERSYSGLGIGLTLVKRLVEMHGGTIAVRSDGANQGSEFVVRLPLLEATAVVKTQAPEPESAPPPRLRVLIVDDNKAAADLLALVVQMLGYNVRKEHDGEAAVVAAAEFEPDVILMDLGMPKLNGYDAARQIRQRESGRRMTLVALTGWGQEEDKQRTREAGFDHHLTKPVEPALLQSLLAEMKPASA